MPKNIIHLEDDPYYAGAIRDELDYHAAKAKKEISINRVATEKDFCDQIENIANSGDVFLLDVMVRWSFPGEEGEIPEVVEEDGYYLAGCRCAAKLLEYLNGKEKKIILYTVYLQEELEEELEQLKKDAGDNKICLVTKSEDLESLWDEIEG